MEIEIFTVAAKLKAQGESVTAPEGCDYGLFISIWDLGASWDFDYAVLLLYGAFVFVLGFKRSPHLLILFKKMLQCCSAGKHFVDYKMSPDFSLYLFWKWCCADKLMLG